MGFLFLFWQPRFFFSRKISARGDRYQKNICVSTFTSPAREDRHHNSSRRGSLARVLFYVCAIVSKENNDHRIA